MALDTTKRLKVLIKQGRNFALFLVVFTLPFFLYHKGPPSLGVFLTRKRESDNESASNDLSYVAYVSHEECVDIVTSLHTYEDVDWEKWSNTADAPQTDARTEAMDAFEAVYKNRVWGTGSGVGSGITFAASTICRLTDFIQRHNVGLLIDAPCGDQQWAPILRAINPGLAYIGVDVVPAVVARNQELFGKREPNTEFYLADLTSANVFQSVYKESRMWQQISQAANKTRVAIMSRHVLEHNPYRNIFNIYKNVRSSRADYFIGTWQPWTSVNSDLDTVGGYRPLDATKEPFNLPLPLLSWCEHELARKEEILPMMAVWNCEDVPL